jgi:GTPase
VNPAVHHERFIHVKSRKFVDSVIVYAFAGHGGNGCVSFRREKFVPRGGPNGGDGGNGGNVILKADREVDSLLRLYFTPHQRAKSAGDGRGQQQHGHNGEDCVIKVPCGTEVWDTKAHKMLADIVEHGQELLVARGGKGGRGNIHWKTASHQTPREHTDGELGEEVTLRLELKLIADIGLVGFPNAGKSSLLTRISDAHPKIAAYPFTTLNPIIGTMIFEDFARITVADLPGLIEDAHKGVGLGDAFLRHLERAPALVYVIDMAGSDGRQPYDDYAALRKELKLYRKDLISRPSLVVANKMDLAEAKENLKKFRKKTKVKLLLVSAATGDGIKELREAMHKIAAKKAKGYGAPASKE